MSIKDVPAAWLLKFAAAASAGDVSATVNCILPNGWLRDALVFTWDTRSLEGREKIAAYLANALPSIGIANIKLEDRPHLGPRWSGAIECAIETGFTFETRVGLGQGYVYLVADPGSSEWKAFSVFMMLSDLKGHEEAGPERGVYGNHTIPWEEVRAERRAKIESDPHVIIIGGGQTGLHVAARFKMMSIPALVVERDANIGDVWRKRYPTLTLHTVRKQHSFLYSPYPANWPKFTPRTKLADWMQQYVVSQDLVVWTNSVVRPMPTYDDATKRWTVVVNRDGVDIEFHPRHIVAAVGMLGDPVIPAVQDDAKFRGEITHASTYMGGRPYAGKRVVVVGAGNSAGDICQDLVHHGARAVTMVQRSSSCVVSIPNVEAGMGAVYPEDVPIEVSDFKSFSVPMTVQRRKAIANQHVALEREKTVHDQLRKGGFKMNMGPDGSGQHILVYERGGGYLIDVGCAKLIGSGRVKVKQGVEVKGYTKTTVIFSDNSEIEADVVLFACGYRNARQRLEGVFGAEFIGRTRDLWGLDEEGEIKGAYKSSGVPGFWWASGAFDCSRFLSKQLAMQIKGIEIGLISS